VRDLFGLGAKRALVVGGGRGMGESTARLLAEAGCDLAILDIDQGRAETVAEAVRGYGRRGEAIVADVLEESAAVAAVAEAAQRLGGIDVLVTIIGQALFTPLVRMTGAEWDSEQRRNLRYFFIVGREVARVMSRDGAPGAICCIASVDGVQSAPLHAAYGAAKAGLIHLVSTMATEWAEHGIRVNAVAPGNISTPRLPETEQSRAIMKDSLVPMARAGTADEIGKSVLFLVSDMASYITGHTLLVDGGWMAANLFDARRFAVKPTTERPRGN
jgi:2-deoxy-D-gluconate 3-dehydrogenase